MGRCARIHVSVCVCVFICVYMYACLWVCASVYVMYLSNYVSIYIWVFVLVYTYVCVHKWLYVWVLYVCLCVYMCIYLCVFLCVYMYLCTCVTGKPKFRICKATLMMGQQLIGKTEWCRLVDFNSQGRKVVEFWEEYLELNHASTVLSGKQWLLNPLNKAIYSLCLQNS